MRAFLVLGISGALACAVAAAALAGGAPARPSAQCFNSAEISGIAPAGGQAAWVRVYNHDYYRLDARSACPNFEARRWGSRQLISRSGEWFCGGDVADLYLPTHGHEDRCAVTIGPRLSDRR